MKLHPPVSHIGYAVADLEQAVMHWSTMLGAGPFFLIPDIEFETITHHGEPAVFHHSAAFGQWGSIAVELMQIHTSDPTPVTAALLPGPIPIINHVAYLSATPEQDSAALTAAGYDLCLYGKAGDMEFRWHDARAVLGHAIEIHRQSTFIDNAFDRIAGAAHNWKGERPLRPNDWMA